MESERCPTCGALLPPAKTCPNCGKTFYRSEKGRRDSLYCSGRCATAARVRRWRAKRT